MSGKIREDPKGEERERNGSEDDEFRIEDKRHWMAGEEAGEGREEAEEPRRPTLLDEYENRAVEAERQLQDYIAAFKSFKQEQEQFRDRMNRDVDRRVELKFSELLTELLASMDDLDRALAHMEQVPQARPLIDGVSMVRRRLLDALQRHGVEEIVTDGEPFDPNKAEAMRVDAVTDEKRDGVVTETLQMGYRLGERVIRPARVAVGRYTPGKA